MNKIKRLPTLEECHEKSYRALYYNVKALPDETIHLVPPQVMLNPEAVNYPVFEFTLEELKDAYLAELENKLEEIKTECQLISLDDNDLRYKHRKIEMLIKNYF